MNPRSPQKHEKFRRKFGFPFPLLVDKGQKVAALYHANGLIVKRTVYLIGPDGVIRFARRDRQIDLIQPYSKPLRSPAWSPSVSARSSSPC